VPAAVGLGVLVDTDCTIRAAGGFLVQLMPGAPDGMIEKLEDNICFMDALTTILAEDGPEEVLAQVMKGLDMHLVERHAAAWRCPCSRERITAALESIGAEALSGMAEDGKGADVDCQFCGKHYDFSSEELREMAERVQAAGKK
jgi:molecular chaperone Hsp33